MRFWRSSSFQILMLVTAVVLTSSLVGAYVVYRVATNRQFDRIQAELMARARAAARLIDGDTFSTLRDPAQQESPEYQQIQRTLVQVQQANPDIRFVYTMRKAPSSDKMLFVVDFPAQDQNGNGRIDEDEEMAELGEEYEPDLPAMHEGLERPAADPGPTVDKWGTWLSGYAPIRNRAGESVGLVGVDMQAVRLQEIAETFRTQCFVAVAAVTIGSLLAAWLVAWYVSNPLKSLLHGIRAVRDGSLDAGIPLNRYGHEFRELATAFNETIAKRRELEEQLRQSAKMEIVAQLASSMTHDFKNHLTLVIGCADLLVQDIPEGSNERELARKIARAGRRAAATLNQILAFARRPTEQNADIDIHETLGGIAAIIAPLFERNHSLEMDLRAIRTTMHGDQRLFESAILNLALNARDAMPGGGVLTLATETVAQDDSREQYFRITVTDTGLGMDEETRRKLFTPFYTTKEYGTGLGLLTVSRLAKSHNAAVRVESTPGKGTRFILDFPVKSRTSLSPPGGEVTYHVVRLGSP